MMKFLLIIGLSVNVLGTAHALTHVEQMPTKQMVADDKQAQCLHQHHDNHSSSHQQQDCCCAVMPLFVVMPLSMPSFAIALGYLRPVLQETGNSQFVGSIEKPPCI